MQDLCSRSSRSGPRVSNSIPALYDSNWEMCANMFGTFEETEDPAKFKLKYWGAAAYLQTGCKF